MRLLALLVLALSFSLGVLKTELATSLDSELDTALGSGWVFACPAVNDACVFLPTDTADTTCAALGFNPANTLPVSGGEDSVCDNHQFNGQVDVASRVDRTVGFWTHTTADIATVVFEMDITAAGSGSTNPSSYVQILTSGFGQICSFQMSDVIGAPAATQLATTSGTVTITDFSVSVGTHVWVMLDYDSPGATCRVRVSSVANSPDTADIADQTVAAGASQTADTLRVTNGSRTNLATIKHLAACKDECLF